jgi:hypothetical protein
MTERGQNDVGVGAALSAWAAFRPAGSCTSPSAAMTLKPLGVELESRLYADLFRWLPIAAVRYEIRGAWPAFGRSAMTTAARIGRALWLVSCIEWEAWAVEMESVCGV